MKHPYALIIPALILLLLLIWLLFPFFYFNNLHKDIKPISEPDRQKAIDILNKTIDLDNYQIRIGNVYSYKNTTLVQVYLRNSTSKVFYIIDLKSDKVVKR